MVARREWEGVGRGGEGRVSRDQVLALRVCGSLRACENVSYSLEG